MLKIDDSEGTESASLITDFDKYSYWVGKKVKGEGCPWRANSSTSG
jgi:hypothetical protein